VESEEREKIFLIRSQFDFLLVLLLAINYIFSRFWLDGWKVAFVGFALVAVSAPIYFSKFYLIFGTALEFFEFSK